VSDYKKQLVELNNWVLNKETRNNNVNPVLESLIDLVESKKLVIDEQGNVRSVKVSSLCELSEFEKDLIINNMISFAMQQKEEA